MLKYALIILLAVSCTPKCEKLLTKCKEKGCLNDSVSIKDSTVIHDSVVVKIVQKDSIVLISSQEGASSIGVKEGSKAVIKVKNGWIKAQVSDSTITISYYFPEEKLTYSDKETTSTAKHTKEVSKQKEKTTVLVREIEKPIPKILVILSIFGGIFILFLLYKLFF